MRCDGEGGAGCLETPVAARGAGRHVRPGGLREKETDRARDAGTLTGPVIGAPLPA